MRAGAIWVGVLFALAAGAQPTTTAIVLNFNDLGLSADTFSGSGTVQPFGATSISFTLSGQSGSSFLFTFADGDTMKASVSTFQGGPNGGSGAANISGGTGLFQGVSGSFTFTFQLVANQGGGGDIKLAGNGTATLQPTSAGPGGSGYPTAGPGGPGYPLAGAGGAQIVLCQKQTNAGGVNPGPATESRPHRDALVIATADCTDASSDSGIMHYPIYDTSDPNVSTQLAFWLTQQQVQAAEQEQKNYHDMLLDLAQNLKSCRGCDATLAVTGPAINIVTPVQTAASTYTASANCPASPGNCWISVPVASGVIAASSRAAVTAVVNPAGLGPGVHTGNVTIAISSGSQPSPAETSVSIVTEAVTVAVGAGGQILSLSQAGLQFQAAAGSTVAQSQAVAVLTAGPAAPFSASASTLSGGNWLKVTPVSGSTAASGSGSAPATVAVQADPSGLAAGQYFGSVTIAVSGAVNSPQIIDVALTVEPASSGSPLITPAGLTFTAASAGNPGSQNVQFINLTNQTLSVTATPVFGSVTGWFGVTSSANSVAAGQTLTEAIAVNAQGLAAGSYSGNLDLHVAELKTDYFVPVVLVVPLSPAPGAAVVRRATPAAVCAPTQLLPVFTNLAGGFQTLAGLPVSVQVTVTDDCGNPLNTGGVALYFPGSGDEDTEMTPLGNGQWVGSWFPHNAGGGDAEIGVVASESSPQLVGSAGVAGTVIANSATPIVNPGGVVSAASIAEGGSLAIAPGEFISIFGQNFAPAGAVNTSTPPYSTQLSQIQVMLGGEAMPLQVTASGQINAVVPYDIPAGFRQQIMVKLNGTSYSMPEPVVTAAAQPSVFTQNQSGSGPGAILTASAITGAVTLNTPSAPAHANDVLEVYCTGLGTVSPAVPAGAAAPLAPFSYTDNTVTAVIGGVPAQVQFAGLAPGYAGLYQVNVTVPSGVKPGPSVPLVLMEAGAASPPVIVAIQ